MVTIEQLQTIFPKTPKNTLHEFLLPLNNYMEMYGIDTKQRQAAFLAQIGHESGGFRYREENLYYSTQGLMKTFRKYFPSEDLAVQYSRQPAKIASRVYANRMGNGTEESGDGWTFRGRGLIQLTGKNNYIKMGKLLNLSIKEVVDYLSTVTGAVESATAYWKDNKLNRFADEGDITGLTRAINGGLNGLEERVSLYEVALETLSA